MKSEVSQQKKKKKNIPSKKKKEGQCSINRGHSCRRQGNATDPFHRILPWFSAKWAGQSPLNVLAVTVLQETFSIKSGNAQKYINCGQVSLPLGKQNWLYPISVPFLATWVRNIWVMLRKFQFNFYSFMQKKQLSFVGRNRTPLPYTLHCELIWSNHTMPMYKTYTILTYTARGVPKKCFYIIWSEQTGPLGRG